MTVQVVANPDGSYQWVDGTFTDADRDAANAAVTNGTWASWWAHNTKVVSEPPPSP